MLNSLGILLIFMWWEGGVMCGKIASDEGVVKRAAFISQFSKDNLTPTEVTRQIEDNTGSAGNIEKTDDDTNWTGDTYATLNSNSEYGTHSLADSFKSKVAKVIINWAGKMLESQDAPRESFPVHKDQRGNTAIFREQRYAEEEPITTTFTPKTQSTRSKRKMKHTRQTKSHQLRTTTEWILKEDVWVPSNESDRIKNRQNLLWLWSERHNIDERVLSRIRKSEKNDDEFQFRKQRRSKKNKKKKKKKNKKNKTGPYSSGYSPGQKGKKNSSPSCCFISKITLLLTLAAISVIPRVFNPKS